MELSDRAFLHLRPATQRVAAAVEPASLHVPDNLQATFAATTPVQAVQCDLPRRAGPGGRRRRACVRAAALATELEHLRLVTAMLPWPRRATAARALQAGVDRALSRHRGRRRPGDFGADGDLTTIGRPVDVVKRTGRRPAVICQLPAHRQRRVPATCCRPRQAAFWRLVWPRLRRTRPQGRHQKLGAPAASASTRPCCRRCSTCSRRRRRRSS